MKKLLSIFLFFSFIGISLAQEPVNNEQEITTAIDEIVIKTEAYQNLNGKVWDMGPYYYCKFTRSDERQAVLDGFITLFPYRMEEFRRKAAGDHGVLVTDVSIINGRENARYGSFEVCAGGTKYTYIKRGDQYIWYRKTK